MNEIEFFCWESDEPITIYLEPEACVFTVTGKNVLRFVADPKGGMFKWSMRFSDRSVQLYREYTGSHSLVVYENDKLILEWE